MKRLAFHPAADQEYVVAAGYYAQINPELGGRFYDEIERLLTDISQHPDRFGSGIHLPAAISPMSSPTPWSTSISLIGSGWSQ